MVGKYRLLKPTLGVEATTHLAMSVPKDSILEIVTAPLEGDRTLEVLWDGKTMIMFVRDLIARADPLPRKKLIEKSTNA